MTIGEASQYQFNVSDDRDIFNVSVVGGLPANTELTRNENVFTLTWELANSQNSRALSFVAYDDLDARASLDPQIQVCACENGGNCTLNGILNSEVNPIILNCECDPGMYKNTITRVYRYDIMSLVHNYGHTHTQHGLEGTVKRMLMVVLRAAVLQGSLAWTILHLA